MTRSKMKQNIQSCQKRLWTKLKLASNINMSYNIDSKPFPIEHRQLESTCG